MNELSLILDEMVNAANGMIKAANELRDYFSSTQEEKPQTNAPSKEETASAVEPKKYTKEQARDICARKSSEDGGKYNSQVMALVKKYANGGTFSKVPAESYADLVAEVEGIGDE